MITPKQATKCTFCDIVLPAGKPIAFEGALCCLDARECAFRVADAHPEFFFQDCQDCGGSTDSSGICMSGCDDI